MEPLLEKATRQHTKDHNNRLVLRTVYEYGEISRAEVARLTGLTRATISEVVSDLIERGLIEEIGHGAAAIGRTPILLRVVEQSRQVAALSVTTDQVSGALVSLRGTMRNQARLALADHDGDQVLATIYGLADQLVQGAAQPLLGIGINTPGLIDTSSGVVLRTVSFGWENLPLGALLQARYNLPVYVSNDSHCLALAEHMFGRQQGAPNLAVVKVDQGIGAGIVLNGHLFTGEGYGAGEIGHLVVVEEGELCKCGNHGCLETVAGAGVILRQARELAAREPASALRRCAAEPAAISMETIAQAAAAGDQAVQAIIARAGRYLAGGLASLVSVLSLRRIVITGRVAPLGEWLSDAVRAELARRALPVLVREVTIEVAPTSAEAPLLGAAAPLLTYELGLARFQRRDRAHET